VHVAPFCERMVFPIFPSCQVTLVLYIRPAVCTEKSVTRTRPAKYVNN